MCSRPQSARVQRAASHRGAAGQLGVVIHPDSRSPCAPIRRSLSRKRIPPCRNLGSRLHAVVKTRDTVRPESRLTAIMQSIPLISVPAAKLASPCRRLRRRREWKG